MIKLPSLHLNSEYSLLESTIKIDDLIQLALKEGIKDLVITDRNNMFGVSDFIFKTQKVGIKPIIGLDLDVEKYRFILLAKNFDGYKELIRLASLKETKKNLLLTDIDDLDLIIIDHPTEGFFAQENRIPHFINFFIGSKKLKSANVVWFNETKILDKKENEALDILSKISGENKINNFDPLNFNVDENNPGVTQAMEIIKQCNIVFPKNINPIPKYKLDNKMNKNDFLKNILFKNFSKLNINPIQIDEYKARLNLELSIVTKLGFADYFLIIWDLVNWAKGRGISIGPGRGSAAGSLISYVLAITEIDPIKFGLLFERFLNPDRVSMPDIDIDIQENRRDEVVKYIFDKYGQDNVGLISTFSKIGAKTALRDIARVMGIPLRDVDIISKMISNNLSLQESYEKSVKFRAAIDKNDETKKLFKRAVMIEGLPRQKGTHAAGIVISDQKLLFKVPITLSAENFNQTQYSMDHLEFHGLLKIDLLGLRNLTIIQTIQNEIFKNYNRKVDLKKIPLSDDMTNHILNNGDTNGIFQLESYGMRETLRKIKVSGIDDIVAIISLFRPGPMDFISEYTDVKNGKKKIQKIHPKYDHIVAPTKGIILFQEQIMMIAQKLTGMSFGQADILRRAISKKKISLITPLKKAFIDGALKNGLSKERAEIIYNKIEKFANYGFNKSHAVAYGIIAYRLAFLKARFPFEFYTALLKSSIGSQTNIKKYIQEAKLKQIIVVAPSVIESEENVINKNQKIILPLTIIKGFGKSANQKIISAKKEFKKFVDFFDFISKVKIHGLGDSQIKSLILANSLRNFGNIKTLLNSLPSAIRYSEMTLEKTNEGYKFSNLDLPKPLLIKEDFDLNFEMNNEKRSFGFNIGVSPTVGKELKSNLSNLQYETVTDVVAFIKSIKTIKDKNNNKMGVVLLGDSNIEIEAFVFSDVFKFIENSKTGIVVELKILKKEFKGQDKYTIFKPWKEI